MEKKIEKRTVREARAAEVDGTTKASKTKKAEPDLAPEHSRKAKTLASEKAKAANKTKGSDKTKAKTKDSELKGPKPDQGKAKATGNLDGGECADDSKKGKRRERPRRPISSLQPKRSPTWSYRT